MYKIILSLFLFISPQLYGQNDTLFELPPLELLIENAIKHSPMLKFYEKESELQEFEVKSAKNNWMEYISFISQYSYGNFDNIDNNNAQLVVNSREETRYSVGVSASITLFDFLRKGNYVKKEKIRYQQTIYQKEEYLKELKGLVAQQYYLIKLQIETFSARLNVEQVLALQRDIAERDYSQRKIPITEYSNVLELYTRSKVEFENVKSQLYTNYFLLEQLIGIPIDSIEF